MRTPLLLSVLCLLLPPDSEATPEITVTGSVVVVKNGKPVASPEHVWVYLRPVQIRGKRFAKNNKVIEQRNRAFIPKVRVVPVGSSIAFPNVGTPQMQETHNVFSPTKPTFDLGKIAVGASMSRVFMDPGEHEIFCDIHSKMFAIVKVVESEWIGPVTNGTFTIRHVPAGSYRVCVWMPGSDEVCEPITVDPGTPATAATLNLQAGKQMAVPRQHTRYDGSPYPKYE
jgi:plastocyanin